MSTQPPTNPVQEKIQNITVAELRDIAKRRGVKLPSGPKDAIVQTLAAELNNSAANRMLMDRLSVELRQALDLLAWNGALEHSQLPLVLLAWNLGRTASQLSEDLQQLRDCGLAFRHGVSGFSISPAVADLAPPVLRAPVLLQIPPAVAETETPLSLDAVAFMLASYIIAYPTRLTVATRWQQDVALSTEYAQVLVKPDLPEALLNPRVGAPPAIWELAVALLEAMQVVTAGAQATVNHENLFALIGQPPTARLSRLYRAWVSLSSWGEWRLLSQQQAVIVVYRRKSTYGQSVSPSFLDEACLHARATLLRLLKHLAPGQWYDSQAVARALFQLDPALLMHNSYDKSAWGFSKSAELRLLSIQQADEWLLGVGAFITQWLRGPLTWLGGIAWKDNFFSLTPLGAWLLGIEANPPTLPASPSPALHVDSDGFLKLDATCTDPAPWQILLQMASLHLDRSHQDRSHLYFRLEANLLATALDSGVVVAPLLDLLQQVTAPSPAAERLLQTIKQWLDTYGRIRIFTDVARLDLADDYALREIEAGNPPVPMRALTRSLAVVPDQTFYIVRDFLVTHGHTPTVFDQPPAAEPAPASGKPEGATR